MKSPRRPLIKYFLAKRLTKPFFYYPWRTAATNGPPLIFFCSVFLPLALFARLLRFFLESFERQKAEKRGAFVSPYLISDVAFGGITGSLFRDLGAPGGSHLVRSLHNPNTRPSLLYHLFLSTLFFTLDTYNHLHQNTYSDPLLLLITPTICFRSLQLILFPYLSTIHSDSLFSFRHGSTRSCCSS